MYDPAWRERVEQELGGAAFEKSLVSRTREGIDVRPLYARDSSPLDDVDDPAGVPGRWPFTRGPAVDAAPFWRCAVHDEVDLETLRDAVRRDVDGGVDSLTLQFDRAVRLGFDAGEDEASEHVGKDGVSLYSIADLERLLDGIDVAALRWRIDGGANAVVGGAMLHALLRRRGIQPAGVAVHFGADPIGSLVRDGWLPGELDEVERQTARLALDCHASLPLARALRVSTRPYHHAGADAALELGIGLATAVRYLRMLTDAGLDVSAAARQIEFDMAIASDVFMEIAKIRACRLLFSKVLLACGAQDPSPAWVFAGTSYRTLTTRDPWNNMLRGTTQAFAAIVGGADAVACTPFDAALGRPEQLGRRVARNTLTILAEESHLDAVADPAGGSYYVEALTDELARAAWSVFREIESYGGVVKAIEKGLLLERITESHENLRLAIERREIPIVGVSEYPDRDHKLERKPQGGDENDRMAAERRVLDHLAERESEPSPPSGPTLEACVESIGCGATVGEVTRALYPGEEATAMEAIGIVRDATPFETLRDLCDMVAVDALRPRAFLANLGPPAESKARASFARNLLQAAGFEVITGAGTGDSRPRTAAAELAQAFDGGIACICGSDRRYRTHAVDAARALAKAGADRVLFAGKPDDDLEGPLREAGVDQFVFKGSNIWSVLHSALVSDHPYDDAGEDL